MVLSCFENEYWVVAVGVCNFTQNRTSQDAEFQRGESGASAVGVVQGGRHWPRRLLASSSPLVGTVNLDLESTFFSSL